MLPSIDSVNSPIYRIIQFIDKKVLQDPSKIKPSKDQIVQVVKYSIDSDKFDYIEELIEKYLPNIDDDKKLKNIKYCNLEFTTDRIFDELYKKFEHEKDENNRLKIKELGLKLYEKSGFQPKIAYDEPEVIGSYKFVGGYDTVSIAIENGIKLAKLGIGEYEFNFKFNENIENKLQTINRHSLVWLNVDVKRDTNWIGNQFGRRYTVLPGEVSRIYLSNNTPIKLLKDK